MIKIQSDDFDIQKIAESGQCFRLNREGDHWVNAAFGRLLRIYGDELDCSKKDFEHIWRSYFDLDTDYAAARARIPHSDRFLSKAADFGCGIRILRQDPWETLISFIISQRKNIPAIKASVEAICRKYGEQLSDDEGGIYSFPAAGRLAAATEEELKQCSLGYRVPYVLSAARLVDSGELDLGELCSLDDDALTEELLKLHGVGIKVASCVALFAYHRINAFPIDVWIARTLEEQYGNKFPFSRYEGVGGIIQQYMFYYARTGR